MNDLRKSTVEWKMVVVEYLVSAKRQ